MRKNLEITLKYIQQESEKKMEEIKYILVSEKLIKEMKRFFIHFYLPDNKEFYFVLARQACKRFKADENYYLARLNLTSSDQNRNLYQTSDDTIVGELSNEQLLALFDEYTEDLLYAQKHFKNSQQKEIESTLEKKELEINLLKKELTIQKLQLEIEKLKNK